MSACRADDMVTYHGWFGTLTAASVNSVSVRVAGAAEWGLNQVRPEYQAGGVSASRGMNIGDELEISFAAPACSRIEIRIGFTNADPIERVVPAPPCIRPGPHGDPDDYVFSKRRSWWIALNEAREVEYWDRYTDVTDLVDLGALVDWRREAGAIARANGTVRRDGSRLMLQMRHGAFVEIADDTTCRPAEGAEYLEANLLCYSFDRAFPDVGGYLVRARGYESYWLIWVSAVSGATTDIANEPQFSPDRTRFVADGGECGPHVRCRVEIWEVGQDGEARVVFDLTYDLGVSISFNGWDGRNVVRLTVGVRCARGTVEAAAVLRWNGVDWALDMPSMPLETSLCRAP